MITTEELKDYAQITGLNLGQAEKDYFQTIALYILYREYGTELVFKGGTALKKCYGLGRFSEDIDFTCLKSIDAKKLDSGFKLFGVEYEKVTEEYSDGLKITYRINGPLYTGIRQSLCKFIVDMSFREKVILQPAVKTIGRFLREIPSFDVYVMREEEILAEKIRAVLTRKKARDIYDLAFLVDKGVRFDENLVKEKLQYYNEKWDKDKFLERLDINEASWKTELKPLIEKIPDIREIKKKIKEIIT